MLKKGKAKQYSIGTLVRFSDSAFRDGYQYADLNIDIAKAHGYLWFIDSVVEETPLATPNVKGPLYVCRSLATGETDAHLFHSELEETSNECE